MIKKEVGERYSAEQAFNHPWIQNYTQLSDQPMSAESINDMSNTVSEI